LTLADGKRLLAGFESWLAFVNRLRRRGHIKVLPMSAVAERARWPDA
jgi:hypothetical protein